MLVVAMAGLPGTGKSTLAAALAARTGAAVLSKDRVRAALFAPEDVAYRREQDDLCFRALLEAAAFLAGAGRREVAIVDGRTFSRRSQVEELDAFADRHGLAVCMIECTCDEAVARGRLERDAAHGDHPARDRDHALYQRLARDADPLTRERLVVATDEGSTEEHVARCLEWLRRQPRRDSGTGPRLR